MLLGVIGVYNLLVCPINVLGLIMLVVTPRWGFFQRLEKSDGKVPMIGNFGPKVSNDWKRDGRERLIRNR